MHSAAVLILSAIGGWSLWQAVHVHLGFQFVINFLPAALAIILVPSLVYRLYAIRSARYIFDREKIEIVWGLRREIIPMNEVTGLFTQADLEQQLPRPLFNLPGINLSRRKLKNGMTAEFFITRDEPWLIIGTPNRLYVISARQPNEVLRAFQFLSELGALSPPRHDSIYPAIMLADVLRHPLALGMIGVGFALGLVLFFWVTLSLDDLSEVSLGFTSLGLPREPIPAIRLMLYPILNGLTYFTNLIAGLFLYRNPEKRHLAYLLWGGSIIIAVMFLIALNYSRGGL